MAQGQVIGSGSQKSELCLGASWLRHLCYTMWKETRLCLVEWGVPPRAIGRDKRSEGIHPSLNHVGLASFSVRPSSSAWRGCRFYDTEHSFLALPVSAPCWAEAVKWKWSCSVVSDSLRTHRHQAPPSVGFSSKSTGVGCHFLLERMKHCYIPGKPVQQVSIKHFAGISTGPQGAECGPG